MSAEPAEVWCQNDANPTAEVVNGVPLCSLCLWKMRSPSWNTKPPVRKRRTR